MQARLSGDGVRAIRMAMRLTEIEFALRLGVTVRTVTLWESDVILPSVLMSMVIRAEAAKLARPSSPSWLGTRDSRVSPPAQRATKSARNGVLGSALRKSAGKHR